MDDIIFNSGENVHSIESIASKLKDSFVDQNISIALKEAFDSFYNKLTAYAECVEDGTDSENTLQAIRMIGVYGQAITQAIYKLKNITDYQKSTSKELLDISVRVREEVENRPVKLGKDTDKFDKDLKTLSINAFKKELIQITEDHEKHDNRIKKLLVENESRISIISEGAKKLDGEIKEELSKITKLYDDSLVLIKEKQSQIDEILSHSTGKTIAGNFEKSAIDERGMANWLRYGSLICMLLIIAVVGYSFWETTTDNFKWENSIFRIILAFLLSVPAAYLARESAKHREQQYNHLQTSLDLKSITPYLASLPEDEQHKLKIDIASRIFAAKDYSKVGSDPYPINIHEIAMELIKKIELPKESKNADSKKS
jgi:hypothetical protein